MEGIGLQAPNFVAALLRIRKTFGVYYNNEVLACAGHSRTLQQARDRSLLGSGHPGMIQCSLALMSLSRVSAER